MGSDGPILAFDTSAAHCAAALLLGDQAHLRCEEMGRGQAEHLMPMIEELLQSQGVMFSDLSRIGVGVGPGNFTGIRISVSAARGLALALDIPAIGITGLAALRHANGAASAAIPAPRDTAYLQIDEATPVHVPIADVPEDAAWLADPELLVRAIAELAADADLPAPSPAPYYLKPADAAPSRDVPPVMLDDA